MSLFVVREKTKLDIMIFFMVDNVALPTNHEIKFKLKEVILKDNKTIIMVDNRPVKARRPIRGSILFPEKF